MQSYSLQVEEEAKHLTHLPSNPFYLQELNTIVLHHSN